MQTVLIVIHFLIVITLVGVILIQPSEGGGLGASGGSELMRVRGTKNPLTRLTAILACCFFAVSIGLIVVGNISNSSSDILERIPSNSKQTPGNKEIPEEIPSSNSEAQPSILEQLKDVSTPTQEQKEPANLESESPVPPVSE
ncbi:preprotein translocase subunit SecG [Bartonella silvatica]|uniref:Protein-export membrane protein SecG n=1 Tax=Bartonella silvatica TaxID=357760 RepID=A0ABV2HHM2_9HYPH